MPGWSIVLTTRFDAGSMSWMVIPPSQIPDGATASASSPLRPLKVLTSSVAATVFEEGSILDRVPMPSLRTQTAPFATASGSGVGADQRDARRTTKLRDRLDDLLGANIDPNHNVIVVAGDPQRLIVGPELEGCDANGDGSDLVA